MMPAAVVPLYIQQGETFSRTATFLTLSAHVAYNTNAIANVGTLSIPIAVGGTGVILAGDYVSFGTATQVYKVATGIADLSLGGSLVLTTPLTVAVPASTKLKINTRMNLTGFSARAQIGYPVPKTAKELATPTQTVFQIMATFLCTIDPLVGEVTYSLTDLETSAIKATGEAYNKLTTYQWDFELVDADDKVVRAFNGPVNVSPEVTKIV
jgi:hypothetical protein